MVREIKENIATLADYLSLIEYEEPLSFEKQFYSKLNHINAVSLNCLANRQDLMKECFEIFADEFDKSLMQNHSRYKPFGYPGDYLVIDWIYTQKTDSQGVGRLWDKFYHRQAAAKAVRNRNKFFCDKLNVLCEQTPNGLSVLNLASGPCRDIAEAIVQADSKAAGSHFHCVDIDERAIVYAKDVLRRQVSNASFEWENANVFKIRPSRRYDLVWSAGLFDYLSDRHAACLLKKMWSWTNHGGKIIVGNFHPGNPNRNYMEWCLDWFLIYRTEEEMLRLCEQSGIPEDCVSFDKEPLGVCIFCIVTRT